jgi:hypothetical protein
LTGVTSAPGSSTSPSEKDADGETDGLGPISLNATPTAPQSSDVPNVQDIVVDPAVVWRRYCAPPPLAPSSVSCRDVPVRADGPNDCQPPAVAAKTMSPLTVVVNAPVVGLLEVLPLPPAASNADVRPPPACPVYAAEKMVSDPVFGITMSAV